eukprot:SAG25_NODE_1135_length_3824_cov_5.545756_4_plen_495_part_00
MQAPASQATRQPSAPGRRLAAAGAAGPSEGSNPWATMSTQQRSLWEAARDKVRQVGDEVESSTFATKLREAADRVVDRIADLVQDDVQAVDAPLQFMVVIFHRPAPTPLGLEFNADSFEEPGVPVVLSHIDPCSEAAAHPSVRVGTHLYAINGVPIVSQTFSSVLVALKNRRTPLSLTFANVIRSPGSIPRTQQCAADRQDGAAVLLGGNADGDELQDTFFEISLGDSDSDSPSDGSAPPGHAHAHAVAERAAESRFGAGWGQGVLPVTGGALLTPTGSGFYHAGAATGAAAVAAAALPAGGQLCAAEQDQLDAFLGLKPVSPSQSLGGVRGGGGNCEGGLDSLGSRGEYHQAAPSPAASERISSASSSCELGSSTGSSHRYPLDEQPISSGFMKSGYDVGERITILSRRNMWRQCKVVDKRPPRMLLVLTPTPHGDVYYQLHIRCLHAVISDWLSALRSRSLARGLAGWLAGLVAMHTGAVRGQRRRSIGVGR